MKKLITGFVFAVAIAGVATPSQALIHKVLFYHESPALRKLKAEHRAKKAAHKMQAKKPLLGGHGGGGCECEGCCN